MKTLWMYVMLCLLLLLMPLLPVGASSVEKSSVGFSANATGQSIQSWSATDLGPAVMIPSFQRPNSSSSVSTSNPPTITLYNGTVISGDAPLYSRPYEGGWMTGDHSYWGVATAVRAEISFPNTNPSAIPSGNWLEGTISVQGQDSQLHGVDYLMRAAYVLYPNGNHGLVADMWQDCEGIPTNNCPGTTPWAHELFAYVLVISGLSASQPVFLEMYDANNVLYWIYSFNGNTWMQYHSFTPPSTFKQLFYLGTTGIFPYGYPYYTAYYYQFGMWSQTQFSCSIQFNVEIQNPSYYQSGYWYPIGQAESMEGPYTYYDYGWTLTNTLWQYIRANVPQSSPQVTFYPTCVVRSALPDNTILWG